MSEGHGMTPGMGSAVQETNLSAGIFQSPAWMKGL